MSYINPYAPAKREKLPNLPAGDYRHSNKTKVAVNHIFEDGAISVTVEGIGRTIVPSPDSTAPRLRRLDAVLAQGHKARTKETVEKLLDGLEVGRRVKHITVVDSSDGRYTNCTSLQLA